MLACIALAMTALLLQLLRLPSVVMTSLTACRPIVPTIPHRERTWATTACGTPARNRV